MSTPLPPAFEPRSREDRTSRLKHTLLVVMISVVVTFLICVVGAVVFYFVAPFAYSPPEDVEIRITTLADDARVLDSIDVNDGFLMDIPPRAEVVVTFHAQALREGDFMDTWACASTPRRHAPTRFCA
jgi:hypothetical protein